MNKLIEVFYNSYEDAMVAAEQSIHGDQRYIFEDRDGDFHVIKLVGPGDFHHYTKTNGWILRGRVFTETKITHMVYGDEE